jgi:hypothetical protein
MTIVVWVLKLSHPPGPTHAIIVGPMEKAVTRNAKDAEGGICKLKARASGTVDELLGWPWSKP